MDNSKTLTSSSRSESTIGGADNSRPPVSHAGKRATPSDAPGTTPTRKNESLMRGDGWIKTYTGKKFWPLDPRADEVDIHDIAHALSMQCRFGGHTRHFYSVAQHSVLVSDYVSRELAIYGLLHDAAEAYLIDLPSPIKKDVMVRKAIRPIEDRLTRIIAKAFDLETAKFYHPEVKKADMVLLATEARDFMDVERPPPTEAWGVEAPMPKNIIAWSQMQAKRAFLQTFRKLQKA